MPRHERITDSPFAMNLRDLMKEFRESQTDLANAITKEDGTHIQRQTISLYVNGESVPDYKTVVLISKHYKVSVDWLVGMPNAVRCSNTDLQDACKCLHISERIGKMIQELIEEFGEYKLFSLLETIYSTYQRLVR